MDNKYFLQHLCECSLEDGRVYIQANISSLTDHAAIGELIAEEALIRLYTPFISLKLAELLVFFGEYVHHDSSFALGLRAKGDVLRYIGNHKSAMECLDAAGEVFMRLSDEKNWACTRISWILACAWLGNVEEALQQANRAREVFLRLGENYWTCIIDHNTAVIYADLGRYQEALKLYENMLAIYPTLTDQSETFIKRSIAMAQVNQAINLAWLGDFEQAYQLYERAQTSFIDLSEVGQVVNVEVNLANLDNIQGYYGSALRHYYQALDILTQNNVEDPLLSGEIKLSMATCFLKINRAYEGCQLAEEAINVFRQFGTSIQTGIAIREYATVLIAADRLQESLSALNEAYDLFSRGSFDSYAAATKLQLAELLLKMGKTDEAYDRAHDLEAIFNAQGLTARSIQAEMIMARSLVDTIQRVEGAQEQRPKSHLLQEAMLLCERIATKASQHNLQEETYKSQYLLGKLYTLQGNPGEATRYYEQALTHIEHILNDLVYDLSPSFLHTTWMVYEDMIALCLQQKQPERAFGYLEQARSMALRQYLAKLNTSEAKEEGENLAIPTGVLQNNALVLRTQQELKDWQEIYRDYSVVLTNSDISLSVAVDRDVIQSELRRCETKIEELFEQLSLYQAGAFFNVHQAKHSGHPIAQVDITVLRQLLTPEQLLLAYFIYSGKLNIFAVTSKRMITVEIPDGVEKLERLLPLLHAHLLPASWPDPQKPPMQVARRLLQKLYDLLLAPIASVLPSSGYLTIVPYGPLHHLPFHALHDGSGFLIEKFQVSYLPASSMLFSLGTYINKYPHEDMSKRKPVTFGYSNNGQLLSALVEAKSVASMFEGDYYFEHEATIKNLIEQASGRPIIHLATHGHSRLDAPNFSSVQLADGQLNAIDAFSLDLRQCELVTLSGCETGLALSGGGDEQLGLGRAFLAAGARSLVISLWSVEDSSTGELMQRFYENLLQGQSKMQALSLAQRSLLHDPSTSYSHPYFWASFRLVGDAGPLRWQI